MRNLMFVVVLLITSVPAFAQTSGFVETQIAFEKGKTMCSTADVAIDTTVGKDLAVSFWGLKTDGWSEFYVGLTKSVRSWMTVTAQVGMEQADAPWRVAGTVWAGGSKASALLIVEEGGSGLWYKAVASYKVSRHVGIGAYSQRFIGTGPYIEVGIGKVKFWSAVGFGQGETRSLSGIKMSF